MEWRLPVYTVTVLLALARPAASQPPPPPGGQTEHPQPALSYEEKEALYREALLALVPRGGR